MFDRIILKILDLKNYHKTTDDETQKKSLSKKKRLIRYIDRDFVSKSNKDRNTIFLQKYK